MGLLDWLKAGIKPLQLDDPDFGRMTFMHIPNAPEKSYWEAEWRFPPLGYEVSIGLPGDKAGMAAGAKEFYLSRAAEFERILNLVRPGLDAVSRTWLGRPLAENIWSDFKLAGFDVEDLAATPLRWNVAFETVGNQWLGITIPMLGNIAQEPVVDT